MPDYTRLEKLSADFAMIQVCVLYVQTLLCPDRWVIVNTRKRSLPWLLDPQKCWWYSWKAREAASPSQCYNGELHFLKETTNEAMLWNVPDKSSWFLFSRFLGICPSFTSQSIISSWEELKTADPLEPFPHVLGRSGRLWVCPTPPSCVTPMFITHRNRTYLVRKFTLIPLHSVYQWKYSLIKKKKIYILKSLEVELGLPGVFCTPIGMDLILAIYGRVTQPFVTHGTQRLLTAGKNPWV